MVCQDCELFPFFDAAYQGFATGSIINDIMPVRMFVDMGNIINFIKKGF